MTTADTWDHDLPGACFCPGNYHRDDCAERGAA